MDISIIIVTFKVRELIISCLETLYNSLPPESKIEVIVVDNASDDGTVEAVCRCFPKVKIIANKSNKGFAAANNQGYQIAEGKYILLLNPDTVVGPDALAVLWHYMKNNPDVAISGPRLVDQAGRIQHSVRKFPSIIENVLWMFRLNNFFYLNRQDGFYLRSEPCDVDYLAGACLMLRRSTLDSNIIFDEEFFMYGEEKDLCMRTHKHGWRISYCPSSVVIHYGGCSAKHMPVKNLFWLHKSQILFFKKHYGVLKKFLLYVSWGMVLASTYLGFILQSAIIQNTDKKAQAKYNALQYESLLWWYWSRLLFV